MLRNWKKDYQIKDVVIPDDGNAISHRFSDLSSKSSGNGIPCHSSWQCWIRYHVGPLDVLTLSVECSLTLKI